MAKTSQKVISGIVTGVLSFLFFSAGIVKVAPNLSEATHQKLKEEFVRFAKVHPAIHFGYTIDPAKYMAQIGIIEVIGAIFLLIGPRLVRLLSCMVLSSVMVGALYTLHAVGDPPVNMIPASVCLLLLFLKINFIIKVLHEAPESQESKKGK